MNKLSKQEIVIVLIISLLSALEPLSIDLYLPGFPKMAKFFNTDLGLVQMSLSIFIGGFAIGQIFWGALSDRYGRKISTILSLLVFIAATVICIYSETITQFCIGRFFQAFGGCAGVVIARAIVNDYFKGSKIMEILSLLTIIAGVAPIIGPIAGNLLIKNFIWQSTFVTLFIVGVVSLILVTFFLPETLVKPNKPQKRNLIKDFTSVLKNRTFVKYTLIGAVTYSIFMVYLGNAPYIIMEYGGLSQDAFSYIFAFNSIGIIMGAWFANAVITRYSTLENGVKYTVFAGLFLAIALMTTTYLRTDIKIILILLFLIVFTMGILFPTTTQLALTPFKDNNGSASALLGTIQLLLTFVITTITNFIKGDTLILTGITILFCHILYIACLKINTKQAI